MRKKENGSSMKTNGKLNHRGHRQDFHQQAGYGLLFLLLIGSVSYVLIFPPPPNPTITSLSHIAQLRHGKKILLAYARSFPYTESSSGNHRAGLPPMLPCPTLLGVRSDGVQKATCGRINTISIGLFPWKSLQTQPLFSRHGECLWYVVAGNVKRNNIQHKTLFNTDSDEWIRYHNQSGVAALLIPKQSHTINPKTELFPCRQNYNPNTIFTLNNTTTFNTKDADQLLDLSNQDSFEVLLISRSDLLSSYSNSDYYQRQTHQLGERLSACFASMSHFSSTTLTWQAPFASKMKLSDDRRRDDYKPLSGLTTGRFPYHFATENLKSKCAHLFVPNHQLSERNSFETNPLFRVWMHSKNQWFIKWLPSCQLDGKHCLKHAGGNYFAMIVYANRPINKQSRVSIRQNLTERDHLDNYLEGNTLGIFTNTTPLIVRSTNHNDRRYCINTQKLIQQC